MAKKDPLANHRRKRLQQWIDLKFKGNYSDAARKAKKSASQIIDTINNDTRSFGAKLARELEHRLGMPRFYLDLNEGAAPDSKSTDPWPFGDIVAFERFNRLEDHQQREIAYWVHGRIADFEREAPNPAGKKSEKSE